MEGHCTITLIDNLCLLWHERQLSVFQINPAPSDWITNIWFSLSWPFLLVIWPLMDADAELTFNLLTPSLTPFDLTEGFACETTTERPAISSPSWKQCWCSALWIGHAPAHP